MSEGESNNAECRRDDILTVYFVTLVFLGLNTIAW